MTGPLTFTRLPFQMRLPHSGVFSLATLRSRCLLIVAICTLAGCSSVGEMLEPDRIDYKSAGKANKGTKLEVPPDLTQLRNDSRYVVGENSTGTATASNYNAQRTAGTTSAVAPNKVAPGVSETAEVRVGRDGNQRWLIVKQTPEQLWPRIKEFWQESGFLLAIETPEAGLMETDWAENRAKIPQDFIRNTIGKVFDSLYSTGERDKFRTRLERTADGGTEIYISHRGAQEVLTGQQKDRAMWTGRPSDPELEAEFIGRLMARLGSDVKVAKAAINEAKPAPQRARLAKDTLGNHVLVEESFDRAWRRVGLALDRVGFTVEDRDRARGLYFVRYVDQKSDAEKKASEPGFFSRLFSSKDEKKQAMRYRILVNSSGEATRVSVQDEKGESETGGTGDRILALLSEQLK
jgi:outer membrane protein assembly factor BamC